MQVAMRRLFGRATPQGPAFADTIRAEAAPEHFPPPHPPGASAPDWITAAESLWGEGFVHPGGAAESVRLVGKLGLTEASTLLLLGAGPGGPARAIARERRCAVIGYEADPDLAALAASREDGAGPGGRVRTLPWDAASLGLREGDFRHALALEPLRHAPAAIVLASAADAMRPGGQLMMAATVADPPLDSADPDIAALARLDPDIAALARLERSHGKRPSTAEVEQAMTGAGFDLRGTEDMTLHWIELAEAGWRAALAALRQRRPAPSQARAIAAECEAWRLRLGLLRQHRLRVVQWYAIRRI